jgi:hypothetical protein
MLDPFLKEKHVADTTLQKNLLGNAPMVEESSKLYIQKCLTPV